MNNQGQNQGSYDPRVALNPGTIYGGQTPAGYGRGAHPGGYPAGYGPGTTAALPFSNVHRGNPLNSRPYDGSGRVLYGDIARGQGYQGYGGTNKGNNGPYPGEPKDTMERPWQRDGPGQGPGGWPQDRR